MFLRFITRKKDGKEHRYYSVVENVRLPGRRSPFQKTLLYLGELSDAQQAAWLKAVTVFDDATGQLQNLSLLPDDRARPPDLAGTAVSLRMSDYRLCRPRQYGACWLACELWRELALDTFWAQHLPPSREGTDWVKLLTVSVAYRLIEPGSEWRCHRLWYERSAMGDLLGEGFVWGGKDQLYSVLDRLLKHRDALFTHLQGKWRDLFGAKLLYDLTSTYFEGQAEDIQKARYGYSRDHRFDCKQVVLALVVTPEGFPVGYEIMDGNILDKQTLPQIVKKIEALYGPAQRVWLMDRGIPTEEQLADLRASDPNVKYLVGTPRGRVKATRDGGREAVQRKRRTLCGGPQRWAAAKGNGHAPQETGPAALDPARPAQRNQTRPALDALGRGQSGGRTRGGHGGNNAAAQRPGNQQANFFLPGKEGKAGGGRTL
jgi:hypothetical protein